MRVLSSGGTRLFQCPSHRRSSVHSMSRLDFLGIVQNQPNLTLGAARFRKVSVDLAESPDQVHTASMAASDSRPPCKRIQNKHVHNKIASLSASLPPRGMGSTAPAAHRQVPCPGGSTPCASDCTPCRCCNAFYDPGLHSSSGRQDGTADEDWQLIRLAARSSRCHKTHHPVRLARCRT